MDRITWQPTHGLDLARQIPETAFEQALLHDLLEANGCLRTALSRCIHNRRDWHVYIEPTGWRADGRLECRLIIEPPRLDKHPARRETALFYFSVNERLGRVSDYRRVVIWWELPATPYSAQAQANQWPALPRLTVPDNMSAH